MSEWMPIDVNAPRLREVLIGWVGLSRVTIGHLRSDGQWESASGDTLAPSPTHYQLKPDPPRDISRDK